MKVLIVCSSKSGFISPFIKEQAKALAARDVQIEYFPIIGRGVCVYLLNLNNLRSKIRVYESEIIHAHNGISGLLASFTKRYHLLITSFLGNHINSII